MVHRSPYPEDEARLECQKCTYDTASKTHPPFCPRCGGEMRTVPLSNGP